MEEIEIDANAVSTQDATNAGEAAMVAEVAGENKSDENNATSAEESANADDANTTGESSAPTTEAEASEAAVNADDTTPTAGSNRPNHVKKTQTHKTSQARKPTSHNKARKTAEEDDVPEEQETPAEEIAEENPEPVFHELDIQFAENAAEQALTKKFLEQYSAESSKKYLTAIMNNSYPYRAYIQKALKEADMPLCLQYLPVIESGYRITALSKSGAHGIWQFMMNSISPYGMRVNMWMDERMDPWTSTDAALKKLKENYDALGSWELALAAYNCGLGAMRKAVKNGGSNDFWELCQKGYIRPETKNYIPKFIAVSTVLSNKEIYGFDYEEPDPETDRSVHFETISVNRNIDLKVLSEKSGIPVEDLRFYNPCLTYGITPPSMSYNLRLPEGTKGQVEELLKNSIPLIKYHIYTVKSGDSLYALARHYGIAEAEIQRVNNLHGTTIKIGQRLMIPAVKDVAEFSRKQNTEKIDFSGIYVVNDNDTLWSLALKFNVPLEVLAGENNMEITDVLRIGSTIKVPIIKQ
ncbi:MAG: transglycosylase SLT domain-containing protein [Treponemataceae bacterium]|nr:transglycosylase SLT domain-containing protein [Treponemataceae bacterium]